jgi:hypothetical protein
MNSYEYILDKYKINPGRSYFIELPNMGRNDLAALFCELEFTKGVEIGVDLGEYSEILCQANPKLHLTGIDPYSSDSYDPGLSAVDEQQSYLDGIYEKAVKRLTPYNCTIARKTSMEGLKDFSDNSLDFVYIDGHHDFVYIDGHHDFVHVTNDIHFWIQKLKIGGILSGHDYAKFPTGKQNHVKSVVDSYLTSYRMLPYFIVGSFEQKEGLIRDKYRSWFWVKK